LARCSPLTTQHGAQRAAGVPEQRGVDAATARVRPTAKHLGSKVIDVSLATRRLTIRPAHELAAARRLTNLLGSCLKPIGQACRTATPRPAGPTLAGAHPAAMKAPPRPALASARRAQLAAFRRSPRPALHLGSVATDPRRACRARQSPDHPGPTAILLHRVLAVVVAERVSRPLRTLTGAVAGLRGGGHRLRVPASGTREVAALATAFNDMSAELAAADAQRKR